MLPRPLQRLPRIEPTVGEVAEGGVSDVAYTRGDTTGQEWPSLTAHIRGRISFGWRVCSSAHHPLRWYACVSWMRDLPASLTREGLHLGMSYFGLMIPQGGAEGN